MTQEIPSLLTLGGLTDDRDALVRVPEHAGIAPAVVSQRLRDGTYDRPFLVDDGKHRALQFGIDASIQSEMRLDDPDALVSEYTRKMMAFLLFCPRPRNVLLIGLGGGSLVKFCHRKLPATHVTAVEIDANVIALRSHFEIPPDGPTLRVVHADGARHVAVMDGAGESVDVMLVDAYDRKGIARSIAEPVFLEHARRVLSDDGIFVMNLAAYESDSVTNLRLIRAAFGEPVIPVTIGWGGNTVVFAGPALRDQRQLAAAVERAPQVQETLGLTFPKLVSLMAQCLQQLPAASAQAAVE